MAEKFLSAAPTFLVRDVERTVEWYEEMLGFEVVTLMRGHGPGQDDAEDGEHEHTGPVAFAIIQRDDVALMLALASEPVRPNREVAGASDALDLYVWMESDEALGAFHADCEAKGLTIVRPLEHTFYDMVEFAVADCDGRILTFGA
ncbi:MAG: hypothetical protein EPO65_12155 [Dehalococcoidia bacterium]|nr:MAG: hypothetical protein EPO65_12155 [Dehalococcoidia bacterium]